MIVDPSLVPLLDKGAPARAGGIRHIIVTSEPGEAEFVHARGTGGDRAGPSTPTRRSWRPSGRTFDWPDVDERSAAAMCYTSDGPRTSPRASCTATAPCTCTRWRSAWAACSCLSEAGPGAAGACPCSTPTRGGCPTRRCCAVPTWIMPDRFLQPEPLVRLIEAERPTLAGAVPAILERSPSAHQGERRRHLLAPAGPVRRLGCPALAAGGLREGTGCGSSRPGA